MFIVQTLTVNTCKLSWSVFISSTICLVAAQSASNCLTVPSFSCSCFLISVISLSFSTNISAFSVWNLSVSFLTFPFDFSKSDNCKQKEYISLFFQYKCQIYNIWFVFQLNKLLINHDIYGWFMVSSLRDKELDKKYK